MSKLLILAALGGAAYYYYNQPKPVPGQISNKTMMVANKETGVYEPEPVPLVMLDNNPPPQEQMLQADPVIRELPGASAF